MANPTVNIEIKSIGADIVVKQLDRVTTSARKADAAGNKLAARQASVRLQSTRTAESLKNLQQRLRLVGGETKAPFLMRTLSQQIDSFTAASKSGNMSAVEMKNRLAGVARTTGDAGRSMRSWAQETKVAAGATSAVSHASLTMGQRMKSLLHVVSGGLFGVKRSAQETGRLKKSMTELGKAASLALGPLNGVAARLTAFSGLVGTANIRVAGFIAALVGAGGLLYAAKRTAASIDETRKSAETIGLSFKAFQELGFVASQSGLRTEQFTTAMEQFSRRLGEVRSRSGTAAKAFRIMFGELSNIENLKVEDAFLQTADAIQKIEDPALRASIAADLFSRRNLRMIKVMEMGSAGIEQMRQKARDLGIILSDDIAAEATLATDRLDQMGKVISANLTIAIVPFITILERLSTVVVRLAPQIKALTSAIVPLAFAMGGLLLGGLAGKKGRLIGAGLGVAMGLVIQNAKGLKTAIEGIKEAFLESEVEGSGFNTMLFNLLDIAEQVLDVFIVTDEQLNELEGSLSDLSSMDFEGAKKQFRDFMLTVTDGLEDLANTISDNPLILGLSSSSQREVRDFLGGLTNFQQRELAKDQGFTKANGNGDVEALNKHLQRNADLKASAKELENSFSDTRTTLEQYNAEVGKLETMRLIVADFKDEYVAAGIDISKVNEGLERSFEKQRRVLLDSQEGFQLTQRTMNSFGDTLKDVFNGSETAMDGFRAFAKTFVDDLINLFLKLGVINPILNSIFDLKTPESGGSGFSTGGAGGLLGVLGGALGGLFGGGGGITEAGSMRAAGGPVMSNQSYLVGEKGPEIFSPNSAGNITPNSAIGGRNVTYNQIINISPGVPEAVRREVHAMRPMLQRDALSAITGAKKLGPRTI